jgi:ankyrin repeat protein
MDKDHSPVFPSTATDTDKLLITSARSGNIEMMEMMLKLEPNIDADLAGEGTVLAAAVKSGKLEAVELLLSAGADVNVASPDGSAPSRRVFFSNPCQWWTRASRKEELLLSLWQER